MSSKQAIIELYADQANGLHRENTEDFLQLEAREKLFHMGSGGSVLDFGCGSADLLIYYANSFDALTGVDISENMIALARRRINEFGATNVALHCGDDMTVWNVVGSQSFDVITSAGVVQYLNKDQIRSFLRSARAHLSEKGRIVIFDVIDPRLYWLVKYGWFRSQPLSPRIFVSVIGSTLRGLTGAFYRKVVSRKADLIGYAHHPAMIAESAAALGYQVQFVSSMCYEYRYHVIMQPVPEARISNA